MSTAKGVRCHRCPTIFLGTREEALWARWETEDGRDVSLGAPMTCPACVIALCERLLEVYRTMDG